MPNFQVFTKATTSLRREPMVTIQSRGTLSLNRSAYARLGEPEAIELLFDPDAKVVGLRAVDAHAPTAHFVRRSTSAPSGPFLVSAMSFLRTYEITVPESRRWAAQLIDDVLCVDLRTESTAVRHAPRDQRRGRR